MTIASGGDDVAAWVPLFAASGPLEVALIVAEFIVLTLGWCGLAAWLVRHPAWGPRVRRAGQVALPLVLIGLGVLVLAGLV